MQFCLFVQINRGLFYNLQPPDFPGRSDAFSSSFINYSIYMTACVNLIRDTAGYAFCGLRINWVERLSSEILRRQLQIGKF